MKEFTLRDYLRIIFRQKWVIIVAIMTITITVALGLWIKTPVYEASVKMLVSPPKQFDTLYYTNLSAGYQNIQAALTQSEIVKSNPVMERTLRAIGFRPLDFEKKFASMLRQSIIDWQSASLNKELAELTAKTTVPEVAEQQKQSVLFRLAIEDLKKNIKVEPIRDTNLFTISYRDFDPGIAAAIANIISRSYLIFDLEQQLAEMQMKYGDKNLAVLQLQDNIIKMEQNLNGRMLPTMEAIGPASVKIIEQAFPPVKPAGLPKMVIFILAVFMSIFLGFILAFGFDYMDQTFKSQDDIERYLDVAFLGSIPKQAKADAFYNIGDQIYFEIKDRGLKSLIVTAALPKEGVTTVTVNVAQYLAAKFGLKTLVIDANLRNPSLHKAFNISNSSGLVDVLKGKLLFDKAVIDINDKLSVLTAGEVDLNPAKLVESLKMAEVLKIAKDKFDVVVIDSPNIRESKDTIDIASGVDGVVLMVNEGRTRRQVAKAALASLRTAEPTASLRGGQATEVICKGRPVVIGVILGNRTFVIPKAIYERT